MSVTIGRKGGKRLEERARVMWHWLVLLEMVDEAERVTAEAHRSGALTPAEANHFAWLLDRVWYILQNEKPRLFRKQSKKQIEHARRHQQEMALALALRN